MAGPINSYPKVVEVEQIEDRGPESGACCPHCGADGRYITWFITEDGARHGAMAGCFKLFPKSRYAARVAGILEKERNRRKLASWDQKVLEAIRALPDLGTAGVDRVIAEQDGIRRTWLTAHYGGRRR
jgi:hypothetical protein